MEVCSAVDYRARRHVAESCLQPPRLTQLPSLLEMLLLVRPASPRCRENRSDFVGNLFDRSGHNDLPKRGGESHKNCGTRDDIITAKGR